MTNSQPSTVATVIDGIPVYFEGDVVTYLGYAAAVTASNAPLDGWTESPSRSVGIRFTGRHGSLSPRMEVFATALLGVDLQ